VHPDLVALLALQADDAAIETLRAQLRELDEQAAALDRERSAMAQGLDRARATAEAEDKKRRDLLLKVQEHKQRQDHNLAALDVVRKPREAAAAMEQVDMMRKVLAQEEAELQTLGTRIHDYQQAAAGQESALGELDERQHAQRSELAQRRADLEAQLAAGGSKRSRSASQVSASVLQKYERIRGRARSDALYPLRGAACGRCNTAIPLQRRNVIAAGRSIEVCEGCGVLLYAAV